MPVQVQLYRFREPRLKSIGGRIPHSLPNRSATNLKASCTIEKAMFKRRHIKALETKLAALRTELDPLKASLTEVKTVFSRGSEAVETELAGVRTELDTLKADVAEVKAVLSRVLGENDGLRKENDRLRVFAAPGIPVKRHVYPNYAATDES
jgi:regulator of replication initiation timing